MVETIYYELEWRGPFSVDEVCTSEKGKGVYQIYGLHPVFGPDSLLYIGMTKDNFSSRFSQHKEWLEEEPSNIQIFLGELVEGYDDSIIGRAEQLLIYQCSPPYNSSNINSCNFLEKEEVVLNLKKRNQLPTAVSSLYLKKQYTFQTRDL